LQVLGEKENMGSKTIHTKPLGYVFYIYFFSLL